MPASRQTSTSLVASSTPLSPQARKNSLPPPNVPAPKLRAETFKPECPSCRYSIYRLSTLFLPGCYDSNMRLNRAMIFVKDINRMTAFYANTLGLKPVEETRMENWVEFEAGAARFS